MILAHIEHAQSYTQVKRLVPRHRDAFKRWEGLRRKVGGADSHNVKRGVAGKV